MIKTQHSMLSDVVRDKVSERVSDSGGSLITQRLRNELITRLENQTIMNNRVVDQTVVLTFSALPRVTRGGTASSAST